MKLGHWKLALNILVVASVISSVAGIAYAALVTQDPLDAGRGGAFAVFISLVFFFVSLSLEDEVAETITKTIPGTAEKIAQMGGDPPADRPAQGSPDDLLAGLAAAEKRLDALEQGRRIAHRALKVGNVRLAVSTGIGTLAWGFGDVVAKWFG